MEDQDEDMRTPSDQDALPWRPAEQHKPLKINRDLLLVGNSMRDESVPATLPKVPCRCGTNCVSWLQYRARIARQRSFRAASTRQRLEFQWQAEQGLRRCLAMEPKDGRAYVSLGKVLVAQRRFVEARKLYEDGCARYRCKSGMVWSAPVWQSALSERCASRFVCHT